MKYKIKEIIIVEGKDDVTAVKKAVDAEVISVHGFGINDEILTQIKTAHKRKGIIVLTDPDYGGEKIRRIISKEVPEAKHGYIVKEEGLKNGDIGIENASSESIIRALKKARFTKEDKDTIFKVDDLMYFKLVGSKDSKERRQILGKELGIGYSNGSGFLSKLNSFGIEKKEFIDGIKRNFEEFNDGY